MSVSAYVYRICDGDTDELLYIGSTTNPRARFGQHRHRDWWPANPRIETTEYPDRAAAYDAEREAIRQERPTHNVKDVPVDIEAYLERQIAEAPPLTNEQRAKLAELLEPVRIKPTVPQRNSSRRSA